MTIEYKKQHSRNLLIYCIFYDIITLARSLGLHVRCDNKLSTLNLTSSKIELKTLSNSNFIETFIIKKIIHNFQFIQFVHAGGCKISCLKNNFVQSFITRDFACYKVTVFCVELIKLVTHKFIRISRTLHN